MNRYSFWQSALLDYVEENKARPFAWGAFDCALFAAGAVAAMTGEDIASGYRGRYTSLAGGLRLLKRDGFASHADLAAAHLPEIHPSQAQVGDIAAVPAHDAGLFALGIVQGERIILLREEGGLGSADFFEAARAFRV
ncbi:hypothetical protein NA8A_04155 [Nitratireductor indicus C115]|uniref:DUF6950 domain-containing protein n=1 Tax=Nitratireductor indicus C115 TaxID=1231190 RepID=K2N901_9HYPH|nr:hypothetical protein [Nitratireductor indicus]EKF43973.1 hypothetical protein NA8A_04155 [Nitratireductor indicus C115]SFQ13016.1 hypothetical protein SAMN05216176_101484 [Nitratireductor indicus]